jgi:hypothetical protein
MQQSKIILYFLLLAAVMASCIKPYDPRIEPGDSSLFVVSGQVTDQEGYQYVSVSIASDVGDPEFIFITGCQAEIRDDQGHVFPMEDIGKGDYRVWMEQSALVPGIAYMVRVINPAGLEIMSEFDRMPACPPVDSVYYLVENVLTHDPSQPLKGIRFYVDLDASAFDSYYFRWEIGETWEYHMDYAREWYFDGSIHKVDPPDYSTQVCWYTGRVKNIFTLSTLNLEQNVYNKFPLHFVDNLTTKLTYIYSTIIRQYALSEAAYNYWDKLRINSESQGGLYEKQPLPVDGNLYLTTNGDTRVLGFFSAVSVNSKRIFVSNVEGLELDPRPLCIGPVPLGIFGWDDFTPDEYPVYFTRINNAIFTLDNECVDCLLHGGVNVKPDFWPGK